MNSCGKFRSGRSINRPALSAAAPRRHRLVRERIGRATRFLKPMKPSRKRSQSVSARKSGATILALATAGKNTSSAADGESRNLNAKAQRRGEAKDLLSRLLAFLWSQLLCHSWSASYSSLVLVFFIWALSVCPVFAGYIRTNLMPPTLKREFRGVWVATVNNIDWPSKPGLPVNEQKRELIRIMDRAAQIHLNAVLFQVRPACDAFYESRI